MLNRREMMAAAAAAAPTAALCAVPGVDTRKLGDGGVVHAVVYDDRFADGLRFGDQARRLGYRTSAISGDVTALWRDDLYHRWKTEPAAIAGLTTRGSALCLKMFAADAGLRCIFRAEHRLVAAEGVVQHRIRAPAAWSNAELLRDCGDAWPEALPHLLGSCPIRRAEQDIAIASATAPSNRADHALLVSWILAPIRRS